MKKLIKRLARSYGYDIVYRGNHPWRMTDHTDILEIDIDFAIARLLLVKPELFFVEVGAFNGVLCDPLRNYILNNQLSGLMIEPQPDPCQQLRSLYASNPRVKIENVAIADRSQILTLYSVAGDEVPAWCRALASFDKQHLLKHAQSVPCIERHIVELEVRAVTFQELIANHHITQIDILQIDTEGFDAEIIRMFPFDQFVPTIVNFERTHLSIPQLDDTMDYLASLGYSFAYNGSQDMLAFHLSNLKKIAGE